MSFILDALRKSETARRRSEAPDLFATMPDTAASAPARAQWPLLAIGAVGVLSLIAALWLFAQRTPSRVTADTAADTTASAPDTAEPVPPASATATPEPAPEIAPAQPTAAPAIKPAQAPEQTASASAMPETANPPYELPAPPQTSPPPAAAMPAGDQVVVLADLDPEARKQLPPLKLSMHLWNETPSQRFIIVDGQRLKEGDVLGEIVIEQITRDGAVLSWRGSRLKIEL